MKSTALRSTPYGRNSLCACGSGKKYKKCCLNDGDPEDYELQANRFSLKQRIENTFENKMALATTEQLGGIKMSEIILDFADELLKVADSHASEKRAIMLAIVAWNFALRSEEDAEKHIMDFVRDANLVEDSDELNGLLFILQSLVKKKREKYASIDRYIVDFDYAEVKSGGHLNVVSIIPEQKSQAGITDNIPEREALAS